MKSINTIIKGEKDPKLEEMFNQVIEDIKQDELLRSYLVDHGIKLNEDKFEKSMQALFHFKKQYKKCKGCKGLSECTQDNKGFYPALRDHETFVSLQYVPCEYKRSNDSRKKVTNNLKSFFVPKKVLNVNFSSVELEHNERNSAIKYALRFSTHYNGDKYMKGCYLHGNFGVGKTYVMSAMANKLAERGLKVGFVYFPDLIRELKSAISKGTLESSITEIKTMNVLILDDIGAETSSAWVRDEILGPILQYRMLDELPTFFTSNKSIADLVKFYSLTRDGVEDVMKAERLRDRIYALSEEVTMLGDNFRY
ncbi:primosomal protein DnaI [Haloplasma contractile]|uniref:Chromosomal replication initiator protein n=1 Tax=Haloplasma contractile SSD-17B TaxID=1033810 RepID=U2DSK1_9MOLU|nr:primosomal protein DnaI [Haloplasma contractile]ERJ11497.1 Chromosomal replication initiator protein [Haloplasma contractile SSD-17B]